MEGNKERGRQTEKREEQKRNRSTPASSRFKEISSEAIPEVAMVMDKSDHRGAGAAGAGESIELQSYGQMGVERAPEWLPI